MTCIRSLRACKTARPPSWPNWVSASKQHSASLWRFQNIIEHAGTVGWVAVQSYHWRQRLGRRVVVIAVADAGIGFRGSLEPTQASRAGDRWGDAAALEAAVFQGVSRFGDPGRGQGIAGMRRYVGRWDGKLSLRSGAARLSLVPSWDDDVPIAADIPPFPGSQLLIIIPAKEPK